MNNKKDIVQIIKDRDNKIYNIIRQALKKDFPMVSDSELTFILYDKQCKENKINTLKVLNIENKLTQITNN